MPEALTIEQVFDIIAPMTIYSRADLLFKKQASRAFNKATKHPDIMQQLGNPLCLDDADPLHLYNDAFRQIAAKHLPGHEAFVDSYGAWGLRKDGEVLFTGDDCGCFPWYETAALLIDRLHKG